MADNITNGNASMNDTKAVFKQIYYDLKKELLEDPAFDFTDESREWIDKVWLHFFSICYCIESCWFEERGKMFILSSSINAIAGWTSL